MQLFQLAQAEKTISIAILFMKVVETNNLTLNMDQDQDDFIFGKNYQKTLNMFTV